MKTVIAICTFLAIAFLIKQYYLFAIIAFAIIPIYFAVEKILLKNHIKNMQGKISKAQEDFKNNIKFKPFLNINEEPWQVLELLPGVTRVQAKNLATQIREIRQVEKFEEFYKIVGLESALHEINKKIIKFR